MISLLQLCDRLGDGLQPVPGNAVRPAEIIGVHISELDDPTPYLEGGELLLTTGIPLNGDHETIRRYVDRLIARGVVALGLGLGAGMDSVPADLEEACQIAGLQLLTVPDGTPFMRVSRAYWDLVGKTAQADLAASLSLQTSLAQAATQPEAVVAVVAALAQALGGWAVYLPADGSPETYWPLSESRVLPALREETKRLDLSGTRAAASFAMLGAPVLEYSIIDGTRTAGFLAVSAGRALRSADRQLIMTGCLLLAVTAKGAWQLTRANSIVANTAATLVLNGYVDAARLVATELTGAPLAERVQLLAVRGVASAGLSTSELAAQVAAGRTTGDLRLRESIARCRLRCVADGLTYLILESTVEPASTGEGHRRSSGTIAAALGRPLLLSAVAASVIALSGACRETPLGLLSVGSSTLDPRVTDWITALRDYRRVDLVETVKSYLRHRGQWEAAARELDIHRNSLRHRIGIATALIAADLDDPDIAANLWLGLRSA